ncbi:MAG: response regulator [Elusimicrobiales bacterium]
MTEKRLKLLAIDDDEECLETLRVAARIAFPDASLVTALDGQKGIQAALGSTPDIILLDVVMPEMDGFETCRRLKEDIRLKDIPVAFLTAVKPDKDICEKALSAGAEAFVLKPFELWELTIQVRTMLKIRDANLAQRMERERLQRMVAQRTRELAEQLVLREKALESLKESEALFKAVFTEAPLGICLIDAGTGRYLRVNPMLARIVGRAPAELAGTDWRAITHPDDVQAQSEYMNKLSLAGSKVFSVEKRYLRPDGTIVWAKMTATPLPSFDSSHPRYLGMVEDISAAKTAEQEKAQLEEQLRQSQKMETAGSLAGSIAHDFNNIISAILAYSDFMINGMGKDDPKRKDAEEIKNAGLRAAALTRQLLAFSRKQVLRPETLDLNQVISGMKPMLRRLIGENIELAIITSPAPALLKADPGCLEQVLLNLCVNARDAMPKGGKLTMESSLVRLDTEYIQRHGTLAPGDYVMFSVSDTGVGMTPETKARLFEPFFTTKPRDKGTGRGTIVVYSEQERGTVFKIYFPRAAGGPVGQDRPREDARYPAAQGTVLVVDDDSQIRTLSRRALAMDGLSVFEASSAEEALAILHRRQGKIDLLLTDMVLPKMTGMELAGELTRRFPALKVIYMSGYTDHAVLANGMLPAGMSFIQKPFTLDLLVQKVREALGENIQGNAARGRRH